MVKKPWNSKISERQDLVNTRQNNFKIWNHISVQALSSVLSLPERPPEEFKQPLLVNPHDDITIRTHHLKSLHGFDPEKTEEDMIRRMKINTLLHFPRPTSSVARERAARLQELIHFCATDGLSQSGMLMDLHFSFLKSFAKIFFVFEICLDRILLKHFYFLSHLQDKQYL